MNLDRTKYLAGIQKGRSNLLIMLGLTLANIVLYIVGATLSFPFSAFLPQLTVAIGLDVYYTYALGAAAVIGGAAALLMLGFYAFCFLLSVKRPGWLIGALVLFALDTAALLLFAIPELDLSVGVDIAFHVWVLYYLMRAAIAIAKLKALPEEPEANAAEPAL